MDYHLSSHKSSSKQAIRRIDLSFSPNIDLVNKLNKVSKLQEFKRKRNLIKSIRSNSQKKPISNVPNLINLFNRNSPTYYYGLLNISPSSFVQQKPKCKYYRPKPLTPASLKMNSFSEYKSRLLVTQNHKRNSITPIVLKCIELTIN